MFVSILPNYDEKNGDTEETNENGISSCVDVICSDKHFTWTISCLFCNKTDSEVSRLIYNHPFNADFTEDELQMCRNSLSSSVSQALYWNLTSHHLHFQLRDVIQKDSGAICWITDQMRTFLSNFTHSGYWDERSIRGNTCTNRRNLHRWNPF